MEHNTETECQYWQHDDYTYDSINCYLFLMKLES